jgi:hypothetical protein
LISFFRKVLANSLMLFVKGTPLPSSRPFSLRTGTIKFVCGAVALILFTSVQFASLTGLFAQQPSPEAMDVVVNLGHGEEITLSSEEGGSQQKIVPTVPLSPNQAVAIPLHFGSDKAGAPVMVGTDDGGQIRGLDGIAFVPADGAVPFNFQPGDGLGTYRVLVLMGSEQHLLQFSVTAPGE